MIVVTEESDLSVEQENQPPSAGQGFDLREQEGSTLRSLTRLLVGGVLVGWDELNQHLKMWESSVEVEVAKPPAAGPPGPERTQDVPAGDSRSALTTRNYLIGLLFETQDRSLRRSKQLLTFAGRSSTAFLAPFERRMNQNPRWRPVQNRFDRWVARGETVAGRWAERGRREEQRSRQLALTAGGEGFNTFMDRLGEAPALQDLVRKQSAGLTQDAVDVVRARTVTGDMMAENVARSLLRRRPRRELAPAPTAHDQESS